MSALATEGRGSCSFSSPFEDENFTPEILWSTDPENFCFAGDLFCFVSKGLDPGPEREQVRVRSPTPKEKQQVTKKPMRIK